MATDFRVRGLDAERFDSLFDAPDDHLASIGACRMVVDAKPGYPCRVSLQDAEIGDTVILLPFTHHDVASPYRASGPIFVRQNVATPEVPPNEVPDMLRRRQLSVRAYDRGGMMVNAAVIEGVELRSTLHGWLEDDGVAYVHVHNAKPGCFACAVERV